MKNLICDLDGTLLDTIFDITRAINDALGQCGYQHRFDRVSCRSLIGDGMDALVRRALKNPQASQEEFLALRNAYQPLYKAYQEDHTCPFEGLIDVLLKLRGQGVKIFVLTNKPHELAQIVVNKYFPAGLIEGTLGQKDEIPPKPNRAMIDFLVKEHQLATEDCLYMGDSHVDVATAHNAGMPCILVKWGYEVDYENTIPTADYVVKKPSDLLSLVR